MSAFVKGNMLLHYMLLQQIHLYTIFCVVEREIAFLFCVPLLTDLCLQIQSPLRYFLYKPRIVKQASRKCWVFGKRSCIKPDTLGCSVSVSVTTYSYRTQWYMSSNTDVAVQYGSQPNWFDNLFNRFCA